MLCCFFSSLNGLLSIIGLTGFSVALPWQNNLIFSTILFILNLGLLLFFIYNNRHDKKSFSLVKWLIVGFILVNSKYFYQLYKKNKHCHHCPNESRCCHLRCEKNISKTTDKVCNHENTIKNINILESILNFLNLLGLIINIIVYIFYRRRKHQCSVECNHI